ncbi:MAG: Hpt domain-containing protein [Spirochaetota bacterium]
MPREEGETPYHEQFTEETIRRNLTSQGHSEETISEVFELLQDRIPLFIDSIEQARASGELSAMMSQAHAAKGVLNTIQLHELAEQARNLEYAAKAGEAEKVTTIASTFVNSLRRLDDTLNDG